MKPSEERKWSKLITRKGFGRKMGKKKVKVEKYVIENVIGESTIVLKKRRLLRK